MTVDARPELRPSYLMHRATRVDAERPRALIDPADPGWLSGLAIRYAMYQGAIHDHHRAKEAVVYLALREQNPILVDADGAFWRDHAGPADGLAATGEAARREVGTRPVVFAGPWVLDHATPARRAELLAAQPLLLRVLHWRALRPGYERLTQPLSEAGLPASPRPEV